MLLPLLVETTQTVSIQRSELTAIYITLGGTIFSALLAALVSFRASNKSVATSREVAELTTRTALDAAAIASQTAKELNLASYKNDFYKMIISRRLAVWGEAEQLIGLLNGSVTDEASGQKLYNYFVSGSAFQKVLKSISGIVAQSFWMGKEYSNALESLHIKLLSIAKSCVIQQTNTPTRPIYEREMDEKKIYQAGMDKYLEIRLLLRELMGAQAGQITTLHNVESFFAQVAEIVAYAPQAQKN